MYTASKAALATLVLGLVATAAVRAQGVNGSITATATVQSPITVTGAQNLAFGNVFPGVAKTIAYSDATNGGRFDVTGQGSAAVTYSFTLPTNLTSSGNNLPIGSWTGYLNTANSTAGGSAITPSATPAGATLSAGGALYVFVGATVTPPSNLPAGSYTGTVTLTVSY
ncbi:MAG: hypothetical protein DMD44_10180 [Gemmatimonadetes bacterium]|nr:MAG: hypothetical protein DMD44_10180 [Gemmatimonadota bacterium]